MDGHLAAKSSRPVLPKPRPAVVALARSIATLPLAAVGLWHEYSKMQARLQVHDAVCSSIDAELQHCQVEGSSRR